MGKIVVRRWRAADAIRTLVNGSDLQVECTRVLYKTLFVPVL